MFKYTRIQLHRSETTTFALDVPPWEVAVLAAVNGEDRVIQIGETLVQKALPDPAAEYDRLAAKYKDEPNSGQSYVAMVYGVGQRGVAALAEEIKRAGMAAETPPQNTPEYSADDDPMKGLFDDPPPPAGTMAIPLAQ